MKWKDILMLPQYISGLELSITALKAASAKHREELDTLLQELSLIRDEVAALKGKVPAGEKNEISKEGPEEIDLNGEQDFRIPMMEGMNLQFEGEEKVIPLNIYGSNSNKKTN